MREAPLFDPRGFALPEGMTRARVGGETACPRRHDAALSRYLREKLPNGVISVDQPHPPSACILPYPWKNAFTHQSVF